MRLKQLDALRAVAIFLVMGHHVAWNPTWARFGWTGVDLFFVLSGFLVSGLLFREFKATGNIRAMRFLGRRAFKIYPAYYLLVAGSVVFYRVAGAPIPWRNIWPDLIFAQSYRPGTWNHLWSLAVEEHFYLLLPLALCILLRKGSGKQNSLDRVPMICAAVATGCLCLRFARYLSGAPFEHYVSVAPSHLRLDALAFGVLLSYLWEFRPDVIERLFADGGRLLLVLSLLLLLPALLLDQKQPFVYTAGLSMVYAGYGGLLLYCLKRIDGTGRVVGMLAKIGAYSYTIYLCHLPVALWSVGAVWSPTSLHWSNHGVFFTYIAVSSIAGMSLATAVERPALRLREILLPAAPRHEIRLPATMATVTPAIPAGEMCEAPIPSGL